MLAAGTTSRRGENLPNCDKIVEDFLNASTFLAIGIAIQSTRGKNFQRKFTTRGFLILAPWRGTRFALVYRA